jgi:hypothetical protein
VTNYPAVCLQGLPDSFISGPWRWGSAVPSKAHPYHVDLFGILDHNPKICHYVLIPFDDDGQPRFLPRVYHETLLPADASDFVSDACSMWFNSKDMVCFWKESSSLNNIAVNLFVVRDRHTVKCLSGIVLESEENCDPTFSADPFVGRVCVITDTLRTHQIKVVDYLQPPPDTT